MEKRIEDWKDLRYGMFIHWGLYSLLERGEWVMWSEAIDKDEEAGIAIEPAEIGPGDELQHLVERHQAAAATDGLGEDGRRIIAARGDARARKPDGHIAAVPVAAHDHAVGEQRA